MNVIYNCFKIDRKEEIEVSLVKIRADWLGGTEKRREWQRMVKIDTDCNRLTNCERADTMPESQIITFPYLKIKGISHSMGHSHGKLNVTYIGWTSKMKKKTPNWENVVNAETEEDIKQK